jgi:hypothetical protein
MAIPTTPYLVQMHAFCYRKGIRWNGDFGFRVAVCSVDALLGAYIDKPIAYDHQQQQ